MESSRSDTNLIGSRVPGPHGYASTWPHSTVEEQYVANVQWSTLRSGAATNVPCPVPLPATAAASVGSSSIIVVAGTHHRRNGNSGWYSSYSSSPQQEGHSTVGL
ncbi:uncharacterized protein LOC118511490 [Anopheles stephensi]|uniref:uncharacterized protein LOC118511490 n=1 Tax=Anopheles stephensi TaxID=30069 RepID=UPI00165891E8|nr:uncharacterized protein LOC118511490 [Anopheles stephensi]